MSVSFPRLSKLSAIISLNNYSYRLSIFLVGSLEYECQSFLVLSHKSLKLSFFHKNSHHLKIIHDII